MTVKTNAIQTVVVQGLGFFAAEVVLALVAIIFLLICILVKLSKRP